MIEENVAIICACLPMCRMVLAWIFPNVFGTTVPSSGAKDDSKESGDPTITIGQRRTRSAGGQWQPYSGPPKAEGINHSVVQHPDGASEEFMLNSMENCGNDSGDGAIRKTTHYEVSYEQHYAKENV